MDELERAKQVPLSFWIIGGLGVLWNGSAVIGYWLTVTHNSQAVAQTCR